MGDKVARDVLHRCCKTKLSRRPAQPHLHQFSQNRFALRLQSTGHDAPACASSRRHTGTRDPCSPCQRRSAPHSHTPGGVWSRWSRALLAHLAHLPHFSTGLHLRGQQTFSRLESELFFSPDSCKEPCLSFSPFLFTRCHQDAL